MGMHGLYPLWCLQRFKSDFSLLGCAATPRNAATKLGRKLHRWLEGIEKGGKRKTDFSYLIFPFSGDLELTLSENRASKWSNKKWNLDGTVLTPAFLLYSGRSTQYQRLSQLIINFFCLRSWSFYKIPIASSAVLLEPAFWRAIRWRQDLYVLNIFLVSILPVCWS